MKITALTRLDGSNPDDVAALARKAMQCAVLTVERDELRADLDAERDAAELKSACITGMRQEITAWSTTAENLEAERDDMKDTVNVFVSQNLALRAERDALKAQEHPPAWRGYALLGSGNYVINHSRDFDKELGAELIITFATEADRAGNRQIGESRMNPEDAPPIQAKDMVIRIGFLSERGLFALEEQLQFIRETHFSDAAGAAPVPEGWRSAVAMAYGHLWHVNNEPMAPIPLRSEESASYAARKLLRDLMTTKERGEAINSVRAMLAAALKEPS